MFAAALHRVSAEGTPGSPERIDPPRVNHSGTDPNDGGPAKPIDRTNGREKPTRLQIVSVDEPVAVQALGGPAQLRRYRHRDAECFGAGALATSTGVPATSSTYYHLWTQENPLGDAITTCAQGTPSGGTVSDLVAVWNGERLVYRYVPGLLRTKVSRDPRVKRVFAYGWHGARYPVPLESLRQSDGKMAKMMLIGSKLMITDFQIVQKRAGREPLPFQQPAGWANFQAGEEVSMDGAKGLGHLAGSIMRTAGWAEPGGKPTVDLTSLYTAATDYSSEELVQALKDGIAAVGRGNLRPYDHKWSRCPPPGASRTTALNAFEAESIFRESVDSLHGLAGVLYAREGDAAESMVEGAVALGRAFLWHTSRSSVTDAWRPPKVNQTAAAVSIYGGEDLRTPVEGTPIQVYEAVVSATIRGCAKGDHRDGGVSVPLLGVSPAARERIRAAGNRVRQQAGRVIPEPRKDADDATKARHHVRVAERAVALKAAEGELESALSAAEDESSDGDMVVPLLRNELTNGLSVTRLLEVRFAGTELGRASENDAGTLSVLVPTFASGGYAPVVSDAVRLSRALGAAVRFFVGPFEGSSTNSLTTAPESVASGLTKNRAGTEFAWGGSVPRLVGSTVPCSSSGGVCLAVPRGTELGGAAAHMIQSFNVNALLRAARMGVSLPRGGVRGTQMMRLVPGKVPLAFTTLDPYSLRMPDLGTDYSGSLLGDTIRRDDSVPPGVRLRLERDGNRELRVTIPSCSSTDDVGRVLSHPDVGTGQVLDTGLCAFLAEPDPASRQRIFEGKPNLDDAQKARATLGAIVVRGAEVNPRELTGILSLNIVAISRCARVAQMWAEDRDATSARRATARLLRRVLQQRAAELSCLPTDVPSHHAICNAIRYSLSDDTVDRMLTSGSLPHVQAAAAYRERANVLGSLAALRDRSIHYELSVRRSRAGMPPTIARHSAPLRPPWTTRMAWKGVEAAQTIAGAAGVAARFAATFGRTLTSEETVATVRWSMRQLNYGGSEIDVARALRSMGLIRDAGRRDGEKCALTRAEVRGIIRHSDEGARARLDEAVSYFVTYVGHPDRALSEVNGGTIVHPVAKAAVLDYLAHFSQWRGRPDVHELYNKYGVKPISVRVAEARQGGGASPPPATPLLALSWVDHHQFTSANGHKTSCGCKLCCATRVEEHDVESETYFAAQQVRVSSVQGALRADGEAIPVRVQLDPQESRVLLRQSLMIAHCGSRTSGGRTHHICGGILNVGHVSEVVGEVHVLPGSDPRSAEADVVWPGSRLSLLPGSSVEGSHSVSQLLMYGVTPRAVAEALGMKVSHVSSAMHSMGIFDVVDGVFVLREGLRAEMRSSPETCRSLGDAMVTTIRRHRPPAVDPLEKAVSSILRKAGPLTMDAIDEAIGSSIPRSPPDLHRVLYRMVINGKADSQPSAGGRAYYLTPAAQKAALAPCVTGSDMPLCPFSVDHVLVDRRRQADETVASAVSPVRVDVGPQMTPGATHLLRSVRGSTVRPHAPVGGSSRTVAATADRASRTHPNPLCALGCADASSRATAERIARNIRDEVRGAAHHAAGVVAEGVESLRRDVVSDYPPDGNDPRYGAPPIGGRVVTAQDLLDTGEAETPREALSVLHRAWVTNRAVDCARNGKSPWEEPSHRYRFSGDPATAARLIGRLARRDRRARRARGLLPKAKGRESLVIVQCNDSTSPKVFRAHLSLFRRFMYAMFFFMSVMVMCSVTTVTALPCPDTTGLSNDNCSDSTNNAICGWDGGSCCDPHLDPWQENCTVNPSGAQYGCCRHPIWTRLMDAEARVTAAETDVSVALSVGYGAASANAAQSAAIDANTNAVAAAAADTASVNQSLWVAVGANGDAVEANAAAHSATASVVSSHTATLRSIEDDVISLESDAVEMSDAVTLINATAEFAADAAESSLSTAAAAAATADAAAASASGAAGDAASSASAVAQFASDVAELNASLTSLKTTVPLLVEDVEALQVETQTLRGASAILHRRLVEEHQTSQYAAMPVYDSPSDALLDGVETTHSLPSSVNTCTLAEASTGDVSDGACPGDGTTFFTATSTRRSGCQAECVAPEPSDDCQVTDEALSADFCVDANCENVSTDGACIVSPKCMSPSFNCTVTELELWYDAGSERPRSLSSDLAHTYSCAKMQQAEGEVDYTMHCSVSPDDDGVVFAYTPLLGFGDPITAYSFEDVTLLGTWIDTGCGVVVVARNVDGDSVWTTVQFSDGTSLTLDHALLSFFGSLWDFAIGDRSAMDTYEWGEIAYHLLQIALFVLFMYGFYLVVVKLNPGRVVGPCVACCRSRSEALQEVRTAQLIATAVGGASAPVRELVRLLAAVVMGKPTDDADASERDVEKEPLIPSNQGGGGLNRRSSAYPKLYVRENADDLDVRDHFFQGSRAVAPGTTGYDGYLHAYQGANVVYAFEAHGLDYTAWALRAAAALMCMLILAAVPTKGDSFDFALPCDVSDVEVLVDAVDDDGVATLQRQFVMPTAPGASSCYTRTVELNDGTVVTELTHLMVADNALRAPLYDRYLTGDVEPKWSSIVLCRYTDHCPGWPDVVSYPPDGTLWGLNSEQEVYDNPSLKMGDAATDGSDCGQSCGPNHDQAYCFPGLTPCGFGVCNVGPRLSRGESAYMSSSIGPFARRTDVRARVYRSDAECFGVSSDDPVLDQTFAASDGLSVSLNSTCGVAVTVDINLASQTTPSSPLPSDAGVTRNSDLSHCLVGPTADVGVVDGCTMPGSNLQADIMDGSLWLTANTMDFCSPVENVNYDFPADVLECNPIGKILEDVNASGYIDKGGLIDGMSLSCTDSEILLSGEEPAGESLTLLMDATYDGELLLEGAALHVTTPKFSDGYGLELTGVVGDTAACAIEAYVEDASTIGGSANVAIGPSATGDFFSSTGCVTITNTLIEIGAGPTFVRVPAQCSCEAESPYVMVYSTSAGYNKSDVLQVSYQLTVTDYEVETSESLVSHTSSTSNDLDTPEPPPEDDDDGLSDLAIGLIAGAGAVLLITSVISGVVCYYKQKRKFTKKYTKMATVAAE